MDNQNKRLHTEINKKIKERQKKEQIISIRGM